MPKPVAPDAEIIDVDALFSEKYEFSDGEIETIESVTFRKSVRRSKDKERSAPAKQSVDSPKQNGGQSHVDYPSTIGPAIHHMRMQQKRSSDQPTPPLHSNKRRKLDNSPSPAPSFLPLPSSRAPVTPTAGPSKLNSSMTASVKVAQPESPDISFVPYVAKRRPPETSSRPTGSVPMSAISQTKTNTQLNGQSRKLNRADNTGLTTKRAHSEVIEILSDGEDEVVQFLSPPRKKPKQSTSPMSRISPFSIPVENHYQPQFEDREVELSSDEDWDPPGFDVNDPSRWTPMVVNENRLEDDTVDLRFGQLSITKPYNPFPAPRYIQPDTSRHWLNRHMKRDSRSPEFVWDMIERVPNLYIPQPARRLARLNIPPFSHTRPWSSDFHFHKLKLVHSFKRCPGSVNRIEQKGPCTVIASGSVGGLPDEEDEQPSAHNRCGSLITWRNGLDIPPGHLAKKENYPDGIKHYAVHDVKFDPHSNSFLSSGADRKVLFWTLSEQTEDASEMDANPNYQWKRSVLATFSRPPHELVFKPNSPILAIAEKKVHIYSFSEDRSHRISNFSLHPVKAPHIIGAMTWGMESTAEHLFISSEPLEPPSDLDPTIFDGLHKVYDLTSQTSLYHLDATEAGDTLAINPRGSILALSTQAPENRHILRLYDVHRQEPKAIAVIDLETFPERHARFEGEVSCSTFSPDGIYLALARNDNHTHVYDVRMLNRGLLFDYEHFGESKAPPGNNFYGVVKAQWINSAQTRRMALVTAGEDGCVRLWNPLTSSQDAMNGASIAEVHSDIGCFSLGDQFAGEHQLIVGDCAGEVTFFNNIVI